MTIETSVELEVAETPIDDAALRASSVASSMADPFTVRGTALAAETTHSLP